MTFIPGKTWVPVSGQVSGQEEIDLAVEAVKSGWWTSAKYTKQFETELGAYLEGSIVHFCNSGSSANLLAMHALIDVLRPGEPVITTAAGFPTTVSAIIHAGLHPVFVDVELGTYNAIPERVSEAIEQYKSRARHCGVILAHTLGHPWDLDLIAQHAGAANVLFVEDN